MKFLVLHGPNLNLFGRREPHIYGTTTLAEINARLAALAAELGVALETIQSNHEGALIDFLHQNIDAASGALVKPAGLTQHGVPLHDAIKAMPSRGWKSICPTSPRASRGAATPSSRQPSKAPSRGWGRCPT